MLKLKTHIMLCATLAACGSVDTMRGDADVPAVAESTAALRGPMRVDLRIARADESESLHLEMAVNGDPVELVKETEGPGVIGPFTKGTFPLAVLPLGSSDVLTVTLADDDGDVLECELVLDPVVLERASVTRSCAGSDPHALVSFVLYPASEEDVELYAG